MPALPPHPRPFLDVRIHEELPLPGITGLCAGYECGEWRAEQLAAHLIEWLPEFALSHKEIESLGTHNLVRLLSRAARVIYDTRTASAADRDKRGEIGELLLHVAIRQVFKSVPAISKFYFKDSANNTVKGFDAVHVVAADESLELWLGEVKFYKNISSAISDVVGEITRHTERNYLRSEFALIVNKIDASWPHAERLKSLLDPNTPLNRIFDRMAIPVFLSYESAVLASHTDVSAKFLAAIKRELRKHHKTFSAKELPDSIRVHLFLLPMKCKKSLVDAFDRRLESCQSIGS